METSKIKLVGHVKSHMSQHESDQCQTGITFRLPALFAASPLESYEARLVHNESL